MLSFSCEIKKMEKKTKKEKCNHFTELGGELISEERANNCDEVMYIKDE